MQRDNPFLLFAEEAKTPERPEGLVRSLSTPPKTHYKSASRRLTDEMDSDDEERAASTPPRVSRRRLFFDDLNDDLALGASAEDFFQQQIAHTAEDESNSMQDSASATSSAASVALACPFFPAEPLMSKDPLLLRAARYRQLRTQDCLTDLPVITNEFISSMADSLNTSFDCVAQALQAPRATWLLRESTQQGILTIEYFGLLKWQQHTPTQMECVLSEVPNEKVGIVAQPGHRLCHVRCAFIPDVTIPNGTKWVVLNPEDSRSVRHYTNIMIPVTTSNLTFTMLHQLRHFLQNNGFLEPTQLTPEKQRIIITLQNRLRTLQNEQQQAIARPRPRFS